MITMLTPLFLLALVTLGLVLLVLGKNRLVFDIAVFVVLTFLLALTVR